MIRYTHFHGVRVSKRWYVVLHHLEQTGVSFKLNSGKRTMREQMALWLHYKRYGWPVAAYPNANAPHIRVGRYDHALDINAVDGGADRVITALQHRGCHPVRPVPGEAWHVELPAAEITKLWQKYRKLTPSWYRRWRERHSRKR